ncbi:MAG: PEP-CTERM sorting domain-containing protein [Alphaproteobacteria bacterium]|nr:PEP-CTERM sorting domain-containing protein [Alphaproteobacteria bacterium]
MSLSLIFRAKAWVGFGLVALAAALAAPAAAQQVTITNVAVPLSAQNINITYGGATYSNVIAGQVVLQTAYAGSVAGSTFTVYAWCTDLYHDIYLGNNTYSYVLGTSVTSNGNGVTLTPAISAQVATLAAYGNSLLAGPNAGNADVSSAIQLAIWQIENPGFTFSTSSTVTTLVAAYEAYAAVHSLLASSLTSLSGAQALVTNTIAPSAPVPEPISAALLLPGLAGMAWIRRRR